MTRFRLDLPHRIVCLPNVLLGDFAQTLWTKGCHVDRGHQSAERLVRADVRCRPLASDVLLARCEGEDESSLSFKIRPHAHETSRHLPHELFSRRQETYVWTAKAHGYT